MCVTAGKGVKVLHAYQWHYITQNLTRNAPNKMAVIPCLTLRLNQQLIQQADVPENDIQVMCVTIEEYQAKWAYRTCIETQYFLYST